MTVQAARRRDVTIVAVGLIVAELAWKAAILRHFYFWQDDFVFFDRALHSGFSWQYLMKVEGGHLDPGPFACSWLLARISLYNWTLVSAVILAILAATGLAMLRLLRTLFGNRPAILIPLVVYLFSPLTIPAAVWWSSAIETLPLQLAACLALDAHVRYVRGRRARHLVASIIWLVAGLAFFEKAMVLPLLLFAVTAAFLTEGGLPGARWPALRSALVTWRRAWLGYASVLVLYAGVFAVQVTRPGATPGRRGAPHEVPGLVTGLIKTTFVPGALGGPWRWFPSGVQAFATPPAVLAWLAVLVAATIVGVSIARRRAAWRAWAILAGWLVLADLVPVIVGRSVLVDPRFRVFLPLDTHYVADAVPILAICLGLAFCPLADQPDHGLVPQAAGVRGTGWRGAGERASGPLAVGLALGVFLLGSAWSGQSYLRSTTTGPGRAYLANARRAVRSVPRGTPVVDQFAGSALMSALVLGPYGYDSEVVGSLAPGRIRWTRQPDSTIAGLRVLDGAGTLRPAAVVGVVSKLIPDRGGCWPVHGQDIYVPLTGLADSAQDSAQHQATIRMSYVSSTDQRVVVSFGGRRAAVTLRRGLDTAYLPAAGSGRSVLIVTPGSARTLCVGSIAVGALLPNLSGPQIPAHPLRVQPVSPGLVRPDR